MTVSQTTTQTRPRLNRKQVLSAALALIDQGGLETLSMRRLGTELGVDPMTIYHHAGKKEDLLDGVAELLWEELAPPEKSKNPVRILRTFARSIRALFQRHPEAAPLLLRYSTLSRNMLELMRNYLDRLSNCELGGRDPASVLRPVLSYAMGYGYTETSMLGVQCSPLEIPKLSKEEFLLYLGQALPADTPPRLADTAKIMIADCDSDQCFEDGLELMLAGLSAPA